MIEKLSEEYQDVMNELNESQQRGMALRQSLEEQSRQEFEMEKSKLLHQHQEELENSVRREEDYVDQIRQLQNEIDELLNEIDFRCEIVILFNS